MRSYKIKAKHKISYFQWMIVARDRTDSFQITKFHKVYDCNLPRLNRDYKKCNNSFIADQTKIKLYQMLITLQR